MAIYGATIGVAVALGPLIGGALTQSLGWESVFYLNVPIGVVAIAITARLRRRIARSASLPRGLAGRRHVHARRCSCSCSRCCAATTIGWGSATIVSLLCGAVVLFGAFVAIERRSDHPMLPLELFRNRAFTGVQLAAFAISASLFALFLYLTLYLQQFLGNSPLGAGVRYLPLTVVTFIVAALSSVWISRVAARAQLGVGLVLTGLGLVLMSGLSLDDSWTALLPGLDRLGRRRGNRQHGHRRRRAERRAEGAQRHGGRDQRHLPPGRHRRRHRRLGSAVRRARAPTRPRRSRPRSAVTAASSSKRCQQAGSPRHSRRCRPERARSSRMRPRAGFLAGLNEVLLLGGVLAVLGAIAAALLVREREIERAPAEDLQASARAAITTT